MSKGQTVRFSDTDEIMAVPAPTAPPNISQKRKPASFKFELGDLDVDIPPRTSKSYSSEKEGKRGDKALKDELLRIFNREKESMEQHYLSKVQELLHSFKNKKLEWEEVVRMEREDLEMQFEGEKSDMRQNFAQEIAKMTRTFQEEKGEVERKLTEKIKESENGLEKEKNIFEQEKAEMSEKNSQEISNVRKECQEHYEDIMKTERRNMAEKHGAEFEMLKNEFERTLNQTRCDQEKKCAKDLEVAEENHQKECGEMRKRFEEEKSNIEKKYDKQIASFEEELRKERNYRAEVEQTCANEKLSMQAINNMLKDEVTRLKDEIASMRQQSPPVQEVKIVEKLVPVETPSYACRGDLPSSLKEDFDRILDEFKSNLKEQYENDRNAYREKLEQEKEKYKEVWKEKEEEITKLQETKKILSWEINRSRDEMEKEIERQYRAKQLSESLTAHQQRFDEVTKRLEEEEKARISRKEDYEHMMSKSETTVKELERENEGLKVKIQALEDNNAVLKTLKEEGQREVERLRQAVEELKHIVENKQEESKVTRRDSGKPITETATGSEITPLLMSIFQQQRCAEVDRRDSISHKGQVEALNAQRKELEELRVELRKHEQDIRDRRTMEDAARMAADKSQEKFESLLAEKLKLEDSLRSLEQRVVTMQEEFMLIRCMNTQKNTEQQQQHQQQQQQQPQQQAKETPQTVFNVPPQPQQQLYAQPPIIMQTPVYTSLTQQQQHHHQQHQQQQSLQHQQQQDPFAMSASSSMTAHAQVTKNIGLFPPYLIPSDISSPSSGDQHHEKIMKLRLSKERLSKQVEELQSELKESSRENVALQKQCREYERQMENLSSALERERELNAGLRDMMKEEKIKGNRLTEQLDKETQNVLKLRTEMEEMRLRMQREIQELQAKLNHASQTLAAVRQQASSEITASGFAGYPTFHHEPKGGGKMAYSGAMYTNGQGKGMTSTLGDIQIMTDGQTIAQKAEELSKLKSLEEEKLKLQFQLDEARSALNSYAAKLDAQPEKLETMKLKQIDEEHFTDFHDDYSTSNIGKNVTSDETRHDYQNATSTTKNTSQSLRNQKKHLQKLIERLSYMNPKKHGP